MRCLWLTRKFPQPAKSGELIYSGGLIAALAEAGAELTVIAHDNDESPVGEGAARTRHRDEKGIDWRLGTPRLNGRVMSLATGLPSDSYRLMQGGPGAEFHEALSGEKWDAVIVDHAAMGWALKPFLRSFRNGAGEDRPKLVYVSHNHESRVRRKVAEFSRDSFPKSLAMRWDAQKYAAQESALCRNADLVTAITDADAAAYRQEFGDRRFLSLTPGYAGPKWADRIIDEKRPRRVVMTGSFEWIAKRLNLERFLEMAVRPLEKAGVELQIVGKTAESFRQTIVGQYPAVSFEGNVPDVSPYLGESRMGLIVEIVGGGFKLKSLDYVFHGLPIAGLSDAVQGLPLESPGEILLMTSVPLLINEVVAAIDDIDRLNRMRQAALRKCEAAFEWKDRGRVLFDALSEL